MGIGRMLGASLAAAAASSVIGGLSLPLILFLGALFTGHSTFDKSLGEEVNSISTGIVVWSVLSLLMGFLPALFAAVFGILPAHLILQHLARRDWYWYAAAGAAAGVASILVLEHVLGYLEFFAEGEGLAPLLIAAGIGGPGGALLFRRILRVSASWPAPKTQPIR